MPDLINKLDPINVKYSFIDPAFHNLKTSSINISS